VTPTTPRPVVGLVVAVVVLVAGVAAALTKGSTTSDRAGFAIASSTTVTPSSSSTVASTGTTLTTTTPPAVSVSTTVRPAVPSPEAAANGLWAAYTANNATAAARFASQDVIDALFATPFSGEQGDFESCRPRGGEVFDCGYSQPSTHYTMTAQADASHSYKIVVIVIESAGTTTDSFSS
jgi:hypothetical protein